MQCYNQKKIDKNFHYSKMNFVGLKTLILDKRTKQKLVNVVNYYFRMNLTFSYHNRIGDSVID